MSLVLSIVIAVLYLAAAAVCVAVVVLGRERVSRLALGLILPGFVLQVLQVAGEVMQAGVSFLQQAASSLHFAVLILMAVFLVLVRKYRLFYVGVFVLPLAVLLMVLSLLLTWEALPVVFRGSLWGPVHLISMLLALAVFILSFGIGMVYLLAASWIKTKKITFFRQRLPSLAQLDAIHDRALYAGFILLTLGIITGAGWSKSVLGVYVQQDFKQLFAFAAWIFYALFFNLRLSQGWKGRRGVMLTTLGFLGVVFLFLGMQHTLK